MAAPNRPVATDEAEPMVVLEDVEKTFTVGRGRSRTTVHAVQETTVRIDRGRCLAVVGESGSGKTTLARMLVGLERPDRGTIRLGGTAIAARPGRRERHRRSRQVQMVFQDPQGSLNRRLPVSVAVTEVLQVHTDLDAAGRRDRCAELFAEVGLEPELMRATPEQLSGGQKQRVAIARALAPSPSVIVLDEAVSALDVTVQSQILRMLERLRVENRLTYLFITHDLAVARQVADDIVVMRRGRIVESGTADEILDHPTHPYTRRLIDSAPRPGWKPVRRSDRPDDGEDLDA
ncbi:ABC transporter ATP-binding protein [Nocardioides sp. SYSU DS0663]|uniref:ABC transporter ATP-binding protein n=1 Tax=Nocardioides sp. SYSU DS0663 TaxID=3416445 RepID=UPI003F4BEC5D